MVLNFKIISDGEISAQFIRLGLNDFAMASKHIKNLPYRRNQNKSDLLCVFNDVGGTCSTKHALLHRLATENGCEDLQLMLGVFSMNAQNTPKVANVLKKYSLTEMPEAHNYFRWKDEVLDFTSKNANPDDFLPFLADEIAIEPDGITVFKTQFHQNFLAKYLIGKTKIPFTAKQFWQIREECIAALQH